LPPEITSKHDTPGHDNHIGHIENAGVKGTNANENKVAYQAVLQNTVDQVAGAARPNQPNTHKARPTGPLCKNQVCQKAEQANPDRDGKQAEAQRVRE
jgi:hypothetical protein